jgi:hypothetical protein
MDALKSCPFCGSKMEVYDEKIDIPGPSLRPHCSNWKCILAAGTEQTFVSMEDLIEAFNPRADLTRPTEDVEKLVDELIEAIRKHDACVRGGYDDYVEEYDKIINNLKSRLLSLNKEVVDDIISAYDDYIKVLSDEIQSSASYLAVHGWKSTRVEAGRLARERIERCKKALGRG